MKKKSKKSKKSKFRLVSADFRFRAEVQKVTSRAELKILQLELWLEPARLGLITIIYVCFIYKKVWIAKIWNEKKIALMRKRHQRHFWIEFRVKLTVYKNSNLADMLITLYILLSTSLHESTLANVSKYEIVCFAYLLI